MHVTFGDVLAFLRNSDLPPITKGKMLITIDNEPASRKLKMELAITVDAIEPICQGNIYIRR